jgi:[acyl-carrier-protein] S-malonyltransferase
VLNLSEAGVEQFVEFGGKVLGGMIKRIDKEVETTSLITRNDIDAFLATV